VALTEGQRADQKMPSIPTVKRLLPTAVLRGPQAQHRTTVVSAMVHSEV
jgi:hypothetical protein